MNPALGPLLAIDTATRRTSLALGDGQGPRCIRSVDRDAGESLLELVAALLAEAGMARRALGGIVIGTGPGSFTGLRVGLATAKTLAYALRIPLLGVPTVEALARAAAIARREEGREGSSTSLGTTLVVVLAAGARDHYLARVEDPAGAARLACPVELLTPGASVPEAVGPEMALSVEVSSAPLGPEAEARGQVALHGLGEALLALGHERFSTGERAEPASLVPEYVALPRGIAAEAGATWSPDLR
ncbi:MAG: tRNA (adenosine(37)-N6)-threonylcarbamoyltransferase complex dimerization subunit type 1 TsaB [Chloroflexota bacterium]|nr:tRNA (adenosine(37)-N6)-threonylcarbamoyltransferase complex dimerization subunit type 1 TsaB [Chloroflexota bacterium]